MTVAPVVTSVEVKAEPARAFEIFTTRIGDWWAKGQTIARNPHAAIILEPHGERRWYEVDAEGTETYWGKVLAWEPPHRLLLAGNSTRNFEGRKSGSQRPTVGLPGRGAASRFPTRRRS